MASTRNFVLPEAGRIFAFADLDQHVDREVPPRPADFIKQYILTITMMIFGEQWAQPLKYS